MVIDGEEHLVTLPTVGDNAVAARIFRQAKLNNEIDAVASMLPADKVATAEPSKRAEMFFVMMANIAEKRLCEKGRRQERPGANCISKSAQCRNASGSERMQALPLNPPELLFHC